MQKEDRPEYGKQYALTGKKSISNGNTWAESEIIKCEICGNLENMSICTSCMKSELPD